MMSLIFILNPRRRLQNKSKKRWSYAKFMSMSKNQHSISCLLKKYGNDGYCGKKGKSRWENFRRFEGNRLEFRCSTVPGKHGEKMVLRILNSDASALNLDTLIHIESVRKDFRKIMNATNGIVIVPGPTGSGNQLPSLQL